jgi:hypothetical protein
MGRSCTLALQNGAVALLALGYVRYSLIDVTRAPINNPINPDEIASA